MTRFVSKAALVILTAAAITGCKKKSDDMSNATKTQLLTNGSWKMTSEIFDSGDRADLPYEMINYEPTYFRDDLYMFKTDGTYIHDEGATKRNPSSPQIAEEGTWRMSADESVIVIDGTFKNVAHVLELSSAVLKFKYIDTTWGMFYSTRTYTFRH
jgi:hypothetical protein